MIPYVTVLPEEVFITKARNFEVPEHNILGLWDYYMHGISTGTFLQAVLTNDLHLACRKADAINRTALFDIVNFLHNVFPCDAWGSPEVVEKWLQKHRVYQI